MARQKHVPHRAYGSSSTVSDQNQNETSTSIRSRRRQRLPSDVPIVGLGCSSFSTFFFTAEEVEVIGTNSFDPDSLRESNPKVREWTNTIKYAVVDCGVNLLDTAPWYGHGSSEIVIGFAMAELLGGGSDTPLVRRSDLIINTKVGRYEADPTKQFDFSRDTTRASVQRSLQRMKCTYIDVLQLHDPEFAPTLDILLEETIPAMIECRNEGYCKALGITGYPLQVQHQILQASFEKFGKDVWDQALTYGHFCLHDTSLVNQPILPPATTLTYSEYCKQNNLGLLAAAPLSMGLLTHRYPPPEWHPASHELREACKRAADLCNEKFQVDIAVIAILFALSHPSIPCTILGMKNRDEVDFAIQIANRFHNLNTIDDVSSSPKEQHEYMLQQVLNEQEKKAYEALKDPINGPFAAVWKKGSRDYQWDGVEEAHRFWKDFPDTSVVWEQWQVR